MRLTLIVPLVALLAVPAVAAAQALPNVNLTRVLYNTRKATVKPEGELKVQVDAVDAAIAEATKLGQMGEVRRQIARGLALLDGKAWTPALDFQHSLVLRTEHTVADTSAPYALRLEQIYRPATELSPALSVEVRLMRRAAAAGAGAPMLTLVRELGTFDGVSRDLRESPFALDVGVAGIEDGPYVLEATVRDGATALGSTSLAVMLQAGLNRRLAALEAAAASVPEALRADVAYPADYIHKVNRGRVGLGGFNVAAELAAAEAIAAAAKGGKDPFAGRTGDFERHYVLDGANEVMPYRVYVPTSYKSTPLPLVVALHGLGGTEDSFFDSYSRVTPRLAEQHGFLLVAPLGYRVDGFYGSPLMGAGDAAAKRRTELSEKDVLEVLARMKAQYRVDESRIYLIGHSMGAIGTWALGAKYPDVWAALVPFSGVGSPLSAEKMKAIPQFVVHGDADPTVNVNGSRTMVAALKAAGANVTYIEVPGGNHSDVVVPQLPKAFEFLAAQKRSRTVVTQQQ
jgi:poly(3-hydroxybutyrate) depolymerase